MNYSELEHAIRATCDLLGEEVVIVFGSQAILGQYPDAPEGLRQSIEADIAPVSNDEATATLIGANLGENSPFHATHGFYVHGLTLPASLPAGWERRTIDLKTRGTNGMTGRCTRGARPGGEQAGRVPRQGPGVRARPDRGAPRRREPAAAARAPAPGLRRSRGAHPPLDRPDGRGPLVLAVTRGWRIVGLDVPRSVSATPFPPPGY